MKIKKGSLGYNILLSLEKATDGLTLESFSYAGQIRAFKGIPPETKVKSFSESIRRLRLNGIIEYKKDKKGQIIIKLSSLGKDFLGENKSIVWDGKYRVIIWDIPESKRIVRNLLRRRLREWGFKILQKSVWVSKRNVTQKLRNLISDLGINKWVVVIESNDNALEHLFD